MIAAVAVIVRLSKPQIVTASTRVVGKLTIRAGRKAAAGVSAGEPGMIQRASQVATRAAKKKPTEPSSERVVPLIA